MKIYKTYSEVPWYRKSSLASILLLFGLVFPPFIWIVAFLLITGHIYENALDSNQNLKVWSKANTIAAWVIIVVQVIAILSIIF